MPNPDLVKLTWLHQEDGYSTRRGRRSIVKMISGQLAEMGFRQLRAKNLKAKHANALVERWKQEGLSLGTLKNRMGVLRWMYDKVGKGHLMYRKNEDYGIGNRQYATNENKARELTPESLALIKSEHVRLSVQLQRACGLRREEAMKIDVAWADKGDKLVLKGSWTKGGRPREIPIETKTQRELLDQARALTEGGSLIPAGSSYIEHLKLYENQTAAAGLEKLHGLRHAYAQERYRELTGWEAPVAGGKKSGDLTDEEKKLDYDARMQVSKELGHGREQVTVVYLGR